MAGPIQKFKKGQIEVAVWERDLNGSKLLSISVQSSYKDKTTGEWKKKSGFDAKEIADLIALIQEAQAFINK